MEKKIREAAIQSLADIYPEHAAANGGKCKRNCVGSRGNLAQRSVSRLNSMRAAFTFKALITRLDHTGQTANDLLTVFQNGRSKTEDRLEHMAEDVSVKNCPSPKVLTERYKEAKRLLLLQSLTTEMETLALRYRTR